MVQDKLLSEEAFKRGLDRLPFVANETKKWEAKLLYLTQRAALARTINISDSVLKIYFNTHKKQYTDTKGKLMDFVLVRELVKNDYFGSEESFLLMRTIELLKQKYRVSIDEELLKQLSKNTKSDSRAIETVFYKPGGTFPRVAFPTIDEAWSKMR
jgi:isocitrate/isopropylmalate dehydrogenase